MGAIDAAEVQLETGEPVMNAIHVLLFLGAFIGFAFVALLALGSLIHLARLGTEALQVIGGTFKSNTAAVQSAPTSRVAHPPRAVPAEIGIQGDLACAAA
jgi:hypothetical protein